MSYYQGFVDELESRGLPPEQISSLLKMASAHPELGGLFQVPTGEDPKIARKAALKRQLDAEQEFETMRRFHNR